MLHIYVDRMVAQANLKLMTWTHIVKQVAL